MIILICLICLTIGLFLFWKYSVNKFSDSLLKQIAISLIFSIVIGVLLETSIFNYRHYFTNNFKSTNIMNNIKVGSGIKKVDKNYVIKSQKNTYIEFSKINKHIDNIYINIKVADNTVLPYKIEFTDKGNRLYKSTPTRYITQNMDQSKYLNMNLSGKTKKIKIDFDNSSDDYKNLEFSISDCKINSVIPIFFSKIRALLLILIIFTISLFKINPKIYEYVLDKNSKKQKLLLVGFVLVETFIIWNSINTNYIAKNADTYGFYQHSQYQDLAISFTKGKLYLLKKPAESIRNMDNPYDYNYRNKINEKTNDFNGWDTAYYKGKYYSYFGVVPVVTAYLPYYLITGNNLPNHFLIFAICILTVIGLLLMLHEITIKWFKKVSFLVFIVLAFWFTNCCGIIDIALLPTLYNIPISFALMFSFFGLYFWISSTRKKNLIKWRFVIGSLCMALVAGCRPQLLVGSLLIFPIFWDSVFKERVLFSKKGIINTILIILPYLIIAVLLMWYNKVRFGSFFNFGANYNLTSNDMTVRGFRIDRIGLGLFSYLFQPTIVNGTFPFLSPITVSTNYLGTTISEVSYGGVLFSNVLLIIGLFFYKFKEIIKNNILLAICAISSISAIILVILDTNMAGILFRYITDFSWLLLLSTFLILMSYFQNIAENKTKLRIFKIVLIFITVSLFYHFLLSFVDLFTVDMIKNNPQFYFKWYYLLQPWI